MSSRTLSSILDSFIKIMKDCPKDSVDCWIRRFENKDFNDCEEYSGVVERMFSENVAVITFGSFTGKQVWENEQKDLARAVLFGNISRPLNQMHNSENEVEELKEGDLVKVRVNLCDRGKSDVFNYCVKSIKKVGRNLEEDKMSKIRDPLRGIVVRLVSQNEGVIKFQTYSGNIREASFSRENFYRKGLRIKESTLSAVVRENDYVYLELSTWDTNAMKEGVGETFYRGKIMVEAASVWLKDDERPRKVSESAEVPEESVSSNESGNGCSYGFVNDGCISDGSNFQGKLVSVERDWGLVAVGEQVHVFFSNTVYLFGLKVEELPLDKIFEPEQVVRVCVEEEGKVTSVAFGSSLATSLRQQAISLYCSKKFIPCNIKDSLEDLNRLQIEGDF